MLSPDPTSRRRSRRRGWAGWPGIAAVLLAILLWLLVKFNQNYTTTIQYPARINNLPAQAAPNEDGLRKLSLSCEGLGSRLFVAWLRRYQDTLELELGNATTMVTLGAEASAFLRRQLPSGVRMLSFEPDSLEVRLETRTNKWVPLDMLAQFVPPYGYRVDSFALQGMDSVRITGPGETLASIDRWQTQARKVQVAKEPGIYPIQVDTLQGLEISPSRVMVYVRPRQYAEVRLEARLKTTELPRHLQVQYFPPTLTLSCITPLENLKRVPATLDVYVPFEQLDPVSGVLYPDLSAFLPPSVELIRWEPRFPAFVIQDTSEMVSETP